MEFISEGIFWEIFKNEDFVFNVFENGQMLRPPSTLFLQKKLKSKLCDTEKSFDTTSNINGSVKSPIKERGKEKVRIWILCGHSDSKFLFNQTFLAIFIDVHIYDKSIITQIFLVFPSIFIIKDDFYLGGSGSWLF